MCELCCVHAWVLGCVYINECVSVCMDNNVFGCSRAWVRIYSVHVLVYFCVCVRIDISMHVYAYEGIYIICTRVFGCVLQRYGPAREIRTR